MLFALESGWTVETWVIFALLVMFAVLSMFGIAAAYRNGATDGYGYSKEPNCPGYAGAGEYLRRVMAHRWPELRDTPAVKVRSRPTVEELDAIFNDPNPPDVIIKSDGTCREVPNSEK